MRINSSSSNIFIRNLRDLIDRRGTEMAGDRKLFTLTEVSKHSNSNDCWIIVAGKVYDATKFLKHHPGGRKVILNAAGKDVTRGFEDKGHRTNAKEILYTYYVGDIDSSKQVKSSGFVIKILRFFVPLLILGLAIGMRKTPSSLVLVTPRLQSGYRFSSMLPQRIISSLIGIERETKLHFLRGASSKDEDQALGPGYMRISIVVPTGRTSTPKERQSIKATIKQLENVLQRIE